jgi:hypothetical protein
MCEQLVVHAGTVDEAAHSASTEGDVHPKPARTSISRRSC